MLICNHLDGVHTQDFICIPEEFQLLSNAAEASCHLMGQGSLDYQCLSIPSGLPACLQLETYISLNQHHLSCCTLCVL